MSLKNKETTNNIAVSKPFPDGCSKDALLRDLTKQTRIIGDIKPNLSVLAKRYQERKSRIDRFTEWYVSKPIWGKVLTGTLLVSGSYTIGVFIGVAWLLTGLVTALYGVAASIMEEHAEIIKKRDALFLEDIPKMEASIEASIHSFRLLEDQLNRVFQSLNTLHTQRAEGISTLEAHASTMEKQNLRYASVIDTLGETAKKLAEHQDGLALNKAELGKLCSELQSSLKETQAFSSTLSGLVSTVEQALKGHEAFKSEVKVPSLSKQVETEFGEIDREIALLLHPDKTPKANTASPGKQIDEDLADIDQALAALKQASKESHLTKTGESGQSYYTYPPM
ncbi:MAG: hypothetical protein QNK11_06300 [Legionella sp.]|nr:hypothetical protein [Legionella sp.]